jgi:hypothetical protein
MGSRLSTILQDYYKEYAHEQLEQRLQSHTEMIKNQLEERLTPICADICSIADFQNETRTVGKEQVQKLQKTIGTLRQLVASQESVIKELQAKLTELEKSSQEKQEAFHEALANVQSFMEKEQAIFKQMVFQRLTKHELAMEPNKKRKRSVGDSVRWAMGGMAAAFLFNSIPK